MRIPLYRPRAASILVASAAALFFALYAFLPLSAPTGYTSPDESSNHFFAAKFAATGLLYHFEPLNLLAGGLVHPRSVKVVDDLLVPGGFLGLPVLYGAVAALAGAKAIPFLTPLAALAGVAGWGLLVGRLFGRRIGIAAAALLAAHPAWWYGAARTMQPNVLFATLAVWAAYFLVAAPAKAALERVKAEGHALLRASDGAIAGVLLGLALAVRPAEAYAVAVAGLAGAAALRGRLPWKRLLVCAAFAAMALAPFLVLNQSLYGSALATGYGGGIDVPVGDRPQGMGARILGPLGPLLFPLGFAPRTALRHFLTYGVGFFWWWSMLVAAALVGLAAARRRAVPAAKAFAAVAAAVAVWLALFYGSWTIQDNPDPSAVTIGSSYLRYWLPVFLLSTPAVAWLAVSALDRASSVRARRAAIAVFAGLYLAAAAFDVFGAPQEGLLAVRGNVIRERAIADEIDVLIPKRSLVVVDRADKFIFPGHPVIYPLREERTYEALGKLKGSVALYYYGISFPEEDVRFLNDVKLPPLGLRIEAVRSFGAETLYEFKVVEEGEARDTVD